MKDFLLGAGVVILVLYVLSVIVFWDYHKTKWHDFFYGLFTWQEKVPIYNMRGNSFFIQWMSMWWPDHYEWKKRKPFFEYLKCKINKEKPYVD